MATMYAVGLVTLLVVVGLVVTTLSSVYVLRRQAESAADLAALAAAQAHQRGGDACGTAARLAEANGARLVSCAVVGDDVAVEVTTTGSGGLRSIEVPGRARAGPASDVGAGVTGVGVAPPG